jgi:hypothetical protein
MNTGLAPEFEYRGFLCPATATGNRAGEVRTIADKASKDNSTVFPPRIGFDVRPFHSTLCWDAFYHLYNLTNPRAHFVFGDF